MENSNSKVLGLVIGLVAFVLVAGGIFWLVSNNDDDAEVSQTESSVQTEMEDVETSQDIVVLASETEDLSTLVSAVKAAGLVETLQGEGPFTVFAPTNSAFEALPEGTLDTLLQPENKEKLASILTYHVVSGEVMSSDLQDGQKVTTVQGGTLTVSVSDDGVYLTDATGNKVQVTTADVEASNGVVHIINGVLLPE